MTILLNYMIFILTVVVICVNIPNYIDFLSYVPSESKAVDLYNYYNQKHNHKVAKQSLINFNHIVHQFKRYKVLAKLGKKSTICANASIIYDRNKTF